MSAITQIKVTVHTGDVDNAGTDGYVYIGICGREFKLSRSDVNDFERASHRDYILGSGANIVDKSYNDPRTPQLDTTDADRFPAYIRFEPSGAGPDWNFDGATAVITPGGARYQRLGDGGGANMWLGQNMGKTCNLQKV